MSLRDLSFSCPGKVFIVGEYTCIVGGDAIVAAVEPSFRLKLIEKQGGTSKFPFAAESPAGRYLAANPQILSRFDLQWADPYNTPIGVGSSSAQFLLAVEAVRTASGLGKISNADLLATYWEAAGSTQGLRPSGVDVLAQRAGTGAVLVSNSPASVRELSARRTKGSSFILAFTKSKAKTHEHLLELQSRGFPKAFEKEFPRLNKIVAETVEAWKSGDSERLGKCMNAYQASLALAQIAPKDFHAKVSRLQTEDGVLGAKGSGAQGGDCVLVLCDDAKKGRVLNSIKEAGWDPIDPCWV